MNKTIITCLISVCMGGVVRSQQTSSDWKEYHFSKFTLHATAADTSIVPSFTGVFEKGVSQTETFFSHPFPAHFDIWIFPDRNALDLQWQRDWGDTTFHAACWMVASGAARRLDVLSPQVWSSQACEHKADDTLAVFQLLTHELVHVYHGQYCRTPDFTGMDTLGWWIEGLATFASGQLDEDRLARARKQVQAGKAPTKLENFWSGPNRYGLSGSVVAWLDGRFGRNKIFELLSVGGKDPFFKELGMEEAAIKEEWQKGMAR